MKTKTTKEIKSKEIRTTLTFKRTPENNQAKIEGEAAIELKYGFSLSGYMLNALKAESKTKKKLIPIID